MAGVLLHWRNEHATDVKTRVEATSSILPWLLTTSLTASAFHVCRCTYHCPQCIAVRAFLMFSRSRSISTLRLRASRTLHFKSCMRWLRGTFAVANGFRSLGKLAIRVQDRCHLARLNGQIVDDGVLCSSLVSQGWSVTCHCSCQPCYRVLLIRWHCGPSSRNDQNPEIFINLTITTSMTKRIPTVTTVSLMKISAASSPAP